LERERKSGGRGRLEELAGELAAGAAELDGLKGVAPRCDLPARAQLLELSNRVKSALGDGAVVLGSAAGGRPQLIASFTKSAVERGLSAADVVKQAAAVMGGGGGGR